MKITYWITPVVIKPVTCVGSIIAIIWGLCLFCSNLGGQAVGYKVLTNAQDGQQTQTLLYASTNWPEIWVGVALILVVPLCLRIVCETIIAIFQVHESLRSKGS